MEGMEGGSGGVLHWRGIIAPADATDEISPLLIAIWIADAGFL